MRSVQAKAGEDGACAVTLEQEQGADPREAIFYALADARLPILEMKQTQASLEKVFLELTDDAPAPAPEKKRRLRRRRPTAQEAEKAALDVPEEPATSEENPHTAALDEGAEPEFDDLYEVALPEDADSEAPQEASAEPAEEEKEDAQ